MMRLRFISVSYQFGSATPSLERHYRELREAMLHPGPHYAFMQPAAAWRPPTDIHETSDAIQVKIELAGMREESIDIALYENALVISGQREDDEEHDETVCYHEAQVRYGAFRVDVVLPVAVRQAEAQATYENGFLRVHLPKADAAAGDDARDTGRATARGQQRAVRPVRALAGHGMRGDARTAAIGA